jgi:hypothetical protein
MWLSISDMKVCIIYDFLKVVIHIYMYYEIHTFWGIYSPIMSKSFFSGMKMSIYNAGSRT